MNGYNVPVKALCDGCSHANDCMPAGTLAAVERCDVAARAFGELAADAGITTATARERATALAVFPAVLAEYLQSAEGTALLRRVLDEPATVAP
ncbi:MAG TPA: hypothetical protein HA263_09300 [Methanoregulaceae archaeon]|nr:hypothetical protein [Methanoregulaceae archaeon]